MNARLQSALEYITTYAWALLIIAVALVAIYLLVAFGQNTQTGPSCIAQAGFTCQDPVLNTSGYLNVEIGQISAATEVINITGVGCDSNQSLPSSFVAQRAIISLYPGQLMHVTFQCTLPSSTLGTKATLNLWIHFNEGVSTGQYDQVATATVSAGTAAPVATT